MLDLESAIKHCGEVAEKNENNAQLWHKQTKNRIVDFCDKAIQAENDCIKCAEEHRQLAEWLKELKQLREQSKWIPVSERLPEYETYVLTCSSGGYIEIQSLETYGEYWENQKGDWSDLDEIIAWMPLPKLYKAESEADK